MAQKWYQKVTVQGVILTGLFGLVTASIPIAYDYFLKEKRTQKIAISTEIKQALANFSDQYYKAASKASEIDSSPRLMSYQETRETLERLNKEVNAYENEINLASLNRLIQQYGKPETKSRFEHLVNAFAENSKDLSHYVIYVARLHHPTEPMYDKREIRDIYEKYIDLRKKCTSARTEMYSFILNLENADFYTNGADF